MNQMQKQAMVELFQVLAEFYKFPNQEFYEYILHERLQNEVRDCINVLELDCDIQIVRPFVSFEEMKQEYIRTFVGIDKPAAVPVESIYKVWTTDESASMGFSKSKGYYMGDSALHIQYLLDQYQLDIPEELGKKPDHISVLLELLSYMIETIDVKTSVDFMEEHFDWLPDLKEAIQKVDGHEFYIYMTDLLICIIEELKQKIL